MNTTKPRAIFIMGPTAAGKTDLALELVERGPCEIVSVDSAQVYRGMDIGTAKPDADTLRRAPHHLIDIIDPSQAYSAYQFRNDALRLMQQISDRGKIPVLVGGTMLYFKSLVEPMSDLPAADERIRADLANTHTLQGLDVLLEELAVVDPDAFARIDRQNPQRVLRALEVYRQTGKPISAFWAEGVHDGKGRLSAHAIEQFPFRLTQYIVVPERRSTLHERIEKRFKLMLEAGFEAEVERLVVRGDLHLDLPSIRSVGYRQMWQYLHGELQYQEMVERGVIATRQLAKRQLTWLKGWPEVVTFDTAQHNLNQLCSRILAE